MKLWPESVWNAKLQPVIANAGDLTLSGTKPRWAKVRNISLALAALSCGGCSVVPTTGPQSTDIRMDQAGEQPESLPYALVKLTPEVVRILALCTPSLSSAFANRTPPKAFHFGIGDTVSVTVFEAAAGGLFIPAEAGVRPGNFVTIPNQAVDNNGNISVPYAGAIRAKGKTPVEVQQAIVSALSNRAIEPQAVVSLVDQRTSLISVVGGVQHAGRFPASASGERVLDVITRAGGPSTQGYDTWVTLERAGHRASVPFGALVYEPSNNIYVLPNDTIYLYNQPQTFVAFGAVGGGATQGGQGQYKFDAWRISLAEAVGKHGGLNDSLADPGAVFLYRGETREVAERLGVDCSRFQGPIIPIIYNVNLRDPSGYFLAQAFDIRNKDVIYTSNSPLVETTKFLSFLRTIMATANDPIVYATNAYALKAAINGVAPTTIVNPPTPIAVTR
jgi:polysaccharide export outer membrane protein